MAKEKYDGMGSDDGDESEDFAPKGDGVNEGAKGKDGKQSNTIIQQINGFSMTPMNDRMAEQTIEDHKYLLELVENKAAIAYFAVANRNQGLFNALKKYILEQFEAENADDDDEGAKKKKRKTKANMDSEQMQMEETFKRIITQYDFMSVVMYPELKKRREFVHDCWFIAKGAENSELKIAISNDPYFYITRVDILQLLKTKDDQMIKHMLKHEIMLNIREDVGYRLVKIKGAQVNQYQQTVVQLVDFISVLVTNKRLDQFAMGDVIFNHLHIVEFLQTHSEFLNTTQAIKVFIMSRKFRLSLQYLTVEGTQFDIDFFTFAIEANAYDIVFYLRNRFEEQIYSYAGKAIESHVQSYQNTPKFLKAKLFLSKSLLPIFNFNGVKQFLAIMNFKIFDHTLENNIFSHSANPLLNMCLIYEFLFLLTKKFFSLSYTCRQLMDQVKLMIIEYIESVDDENFLTEVMLEKDYNGRDSLQIAVELEVLDLIQAPKVEAVIKRILNSDFDTSGSLFEMSTPYQILSQPSTSDVDIEIKNRFYKMRDIEGTPQYDSNFNIFQQSMYSRLKGMGIISSLFVIISIYFYEIAIEESLILRPIIEDLIDLKTEVTTTNQLTVIVNGITNMDKTYLAIEVPVNALYWAFTQIKVLCMLNLMFFITQLIQMIFLKKLNRVYAFPTLGIFTDAILFICSILTIQWIHQNIQLDIDIPGVSAEENTQRKLANFLINITYKFEYNLSIMITCLILRITDLLQFSSEIGPLIKIVGKMTSDFLNFFALYCILVIMFAIVGNINFIFDLKEQFGGLFESVLTVLDTSIGNYNFQVFESIENDNFLVLFGDLYTIAIVITFNILILNLIIAILSNTYNMFDTKSTGLYLSKILNARDEMTYDENYGAFLLTMTPLNFVILPFVPYGVMKKPSPQMNMGVMILQYSVLIIIICIAFLACSVLMLPFAYVRAFTIKASKISKAVTTYEQVTSILSAFFFAVLGGPSLTIGLLSDFYFFWANNFRSNLKKIIIERKLSSITNESIRNLFLLCSRYSSLKIKSLYSIDYVKTFRNRFLVKQNIQYLLFGQMIPENGFGNSNTLSQNDNTLKSLKTGNLMEYKKKVRELEDTSAQIKKSRYDIDQYNQIKSCLMNFSFDNRGQKTLSVEIIENVMDELRRERKIKMVLADSGIEEYIKLDLEGVSLEDEDISPEVKKVLQDKKKFKEKLCQTVSILRLGYIFKVLKMIHPGKASMLGAEAFKIKVMKLEKGEDSKKTKKKNFQQSASGGLGSMSMDSVAMKMEEKANNISDPMLIGINEFVQSLKMDIMSAGANKLNQISKLYKDFNKAEAKRIAKEMEMQAMKKEEDLAPVDTVDQMLNEIENGSGSGSQKQNSITPGQDI